MQRGLVAFRICTVFLRRRRFPPTPVPVNAEDQKTVQKLVARGISLRSILELWHSALKQWAIDEKCTTGEFAHRVIIPLTSETGTSYAEYIADMKSEPLCSADIHVVHSWRLNFQDAILALASYANKCNSLSPSRSELLDIAWHETHQPRNLQTRFFFCPFSVNQHSLNGVSVGDNACEIDKFHKVALEVHRRSNQPMVVVLDNTCMTLTRCCCLEEIHAAITEGIPIEYIGKGCMNFDGNVDAERAEAWDIGVQRAILKKIRHLGFERFNAIVKSDIQQYAKKNLEDLKLLLSSSPNWTTTRLMPEVHQVDVKKFLVIGQCGDGKSTLINYFRDPLRTKPPRLGMNPKGVTKKIQEYPCRPMRGCDILLYDTPGVGDRTISPMELIGLLERHIIGCQIDSIGQIDPRPGIHGIIVTNKIPDSRMTLGATVVQTFVEKGMVHGVDEQEQWSNVVLVGTKKDLATAKQVHAFFHATEEEWEENGRVEKETIPSLASVFFENAPPQAGAVVAVDQDDYTQLEEAILNMPNMRIHYRPPPESEMAAALAEKLGIERAVFQVQLAQERSKLIKEFEEQASKMRRSRQIALNAIIVALKASRANFHSDSSGGAQTSEKNSTRGTPSPNKKDISSPSRCSSPKTRSSSPFVKAGSHDDGMLEPGLDDSTSPRARGVRALSETPPKKPSDFADFPPLPLFQDC